MTVPPDARVDGRIGAGLGAKLGTRLGEGLGGPDDLLGIGVGTPVGDPAPVS